MRGAGISIDWEHGALRRTCQRKYSGLERADTELLCRSPVFFLVTGDATARFGAV
jgi:hypothetical protein